METNIAVFRGKGIRKTIHKNEWWFSISDKAKGYSDDWLEKRMRGIAIREELTDEWRKREVRRETEYAILTAEIAKTVLVV